MKSFAINTIICQFLVATLFTNYFHKTNKFNENNDSLGAHYICSSAGIFKLSVSDEKSDKWQSCDFCITSDELGRTREDRILIAVKFPRKLDMVLSHQSFIASPEKILSIPRSPPYALI